MKNLKKILSAVFFSISFCAFSEISFESPEINSQDKILFTINREKRLFTYSFILKQLSKDIEYDLKKKENDNISMSKLYKLILYKRKIIM